MMKSVSENQSSNTFKSRPLEHFSAPWQTQVGSLMSSDVPGISGIALPKMELQQKQLVGTWVFNEH
jgi:hypothetical protein